MDLNAIRQFLKVAECLSFTDAAAQLGVTQSGVSRAISRLEQQLGVRLLHRSTRRLSLTADGQVFYQRSAPLLGDLAALGQELQERRSCPSGRLKISAPSAFGRAVLMPILANLLKQHPQLSIEVVMSDRMVDLVEEGFDAVLRTGDIRDQRLIARPLAPLTWLTVASPEYLAAHGTPKHPDELSSHNCLQVRNPYTGRAVPWRFIEAGKESSRQLEGNLMFDHGDPLLDAAQQGIGIAQIMAFFTRDAMAQGSLQPILETFNPAPHALSLVHQPSKQHSAKLQVFKHALLQAWGE
ncbi:LysR family transcriptional regulator [Bacterioplanes sanyensis]|uniref:LysR family transcriptional regulator n=1 Tax=Bacterioplanes sanyensis TaxID=1249553 RepID=A0A222FF43_9GAMM|nr:LysR family transcriptional regulator [Bacterioplanes sanyensis]ASP37380.1 LysR family transcriptional regulator [Bacterioplanes sanyensis]